MATGLEVPGFIIGAASITFQVFAGAVQGFKLLSAAHRVGKDAELLLCMLRLEEYRLILWSRSSGLIEDALDERLNATLIHEVLAQLRSLLTDTDKLRSRYKLELKEQRVEPSKKFVVGPDRDQLDFMHDSVIVLEQDAIIAKAKLDHAKNAFVKRLWWAAVDRKGLEELLSHIRALIQRLYDLLGVLDREDSQQQFRLVQMALINVTEKLEGIKVIQEALQQGPSPDLTMNTVAALKALKIELDDSERTPALPTPPGLPPLSYEMLTDIQSIGAARMVAMAKYDKVPVLVERKSYSVDADIITMSKRVSALSLLLHVPKPSSFRTLHCRGVIQDPMKLESLFVLERPSYSSSKVTPRTLLSLLQSSYTPSLTDRFRLSTDVATTLLHLHSSGWLHKGLRSENVLFIPTSEEAPRSIEDPYVMGYEYARHDRLGEISEKASENPSVDIYRHPQAQGPASSTFIKAFDVYALGIMLIEIALWRPFGVIVEKIGFCARNVNPATMQAMRLRLLQEDGRPSYPQELRFRMGNIYARVVRCCLATMFEDPTLSRKEFISLYYENVVRPLKSCVA